MISSNVWVFILQKQIHVMMRENLKTKCCEYIAVYVNDLYIAFHKALKTLLTLSKPELKLKIKRNEKLAYDPGGIMVCQLKNHMEELNWLYNRLFKDNPPKDLRTLLDKIDLPSVYHMIMKILITKGNPTLMVTEVSLQNTHSQWMYG